MVARWLKGGGGVQGLVLGWYESNAGAMREQYGQCGGSAEAVREGGVGMGWQSAGGPGLIQQTAWT